MGCKNKKVVLLGCTGSIGDTCFKVLENLGEGYEVLGLSGGTRVDKLIELIGRWQPRKVCVLDEEARSEVRSARPGTEVLCGEEDLCELAAMPDADIVLNGLVGAVGLAPTLVALAEGKTVGMANKEPLVMAGGLVLQQAQLGGGTLLPLDSEPNAVWQCLKGEDPKALRRIILTASGGPFFGLRREQMREISPQQALNHPTWKMGSKITVDSATLMNKGFEVIEAKWLFDVRIDQVDVVVRSPEKCCILVIESVDFNDGEIFGKMGDDLQKTTDGFERNTGDQIIANIRIETLLHYDLSIRVKAEQNHIHITAGWYSPYPFDKWTFERIIEQERVALCINVNL